MTDDLPAPPALSDTECACATLRGRLDRIEALFNGGPDTSCRTVWDDGIECVSVPLDELRAAMALPSRWTTHPAPHAEARGAHALDH